MRPAGVEPVTVVSVYGVIDVYAQTTMLRILADLLPLFDSLDGRRVILGGDFNVTTATRAEELPRYRAIFQVLESFGLENVFATARERPPSVAGCQCDLAARCFHVRTHRNQSVVGTPREALGAHLDYLFATPDLASRCSRIRLDDDPSIWSLSDHCPVIADFELPAAPPGPTWDDRLGRDIAAAIGNSLEARPARAAWKPASRVSTRCREAWIAAFQPGVFADGSPAMLEVGLWRPSELAPDVVAYAGFTEGPPAATRPTTTDPAIRPIARPHCTYLTTPIVDLTALERSLEEVHEALLAASCSPMHDPPIGRMP